MYEDNEDNDTREEHSESSMDEIVSFAIEGSLKIFDPNTDEILVNKRG